MFSIRIYQVSRIVSRITWCLVILPLFGCAMVGQDYVRPDMALSDTWNTGLAGGLSKSEPDTRELSGWWKKLDDPELTALVERAVKTNLDLKEAKARLREARAQRIIEKSDLFPTLEATGSVTRSKSSGDAAETIYSAGFDSGWEIDLFGGVRRSVEAANADMLSAVENVNDVLVSLTAEVALNYVELRMYQARLAVAQKNLQMQEETYRLEQHRLAAGLSDELAEAQARSNMESTRAGIPSVRVQVEQAKNRIAVLLGEQPGKLNEELDTSAPIPTVPVDVAVGVPADVLRRRPDVRKAEQDLIAQTARVGVAQADLYPKLTLNGSIGYDALSSKDLFKAGSRAWSFGPKITWPIFQAGSIRANIEVASAQQEQTLAGYESAVLTALEEVENGMVAYVQEQIRRETLKAAADAARQAVDFAQNKYDAGLTDFDSLLDAQRTLLSYEDELVQSEAAVVTDLVSLYKALGGGWTSMVPGADASGSY